MSLWTLVAEVLRPCTIGVHGLQQFAHFENLWHTHMKLLCACTAHHYAGTELNLVGGMSSTANYVLSS